jgi:two-component system cell cycle sensor histidine kinase/response regulator CckA
LIRVSADLLAIQREEGSAAITRVMGHLARFGQGDRAYIFRLDQGGDTVTNTHEWCDKGITPQQEQLQAVPVSLFEWWMERMYRGEPIHLASLDDLPPEAADGREMLASQGIHSLVALPLRDGQRLLGFLGIDWVRRPTTLEPELVSMLQLGANLIRNSLERQRVLEELETSRQKMELALRGADQGTWNWYPETGRLEVDERWCTMLGLIPDQVPPVISSWENRLHPEDRSRVLALLGEVLDGHNDSYETRHRLRNADGHWIWVLAKGRVMERGPEGRPLRMSGTHLDVSQQERSSRIWRSAFHHSSQLMALTTATDRRFLEVNRAFLQTLGLQRDEVLGRTTEELGLEGAEGLGERIQEQFRREGVVRDFEVSLRARDGRVIQGLFSIDPVELEDDQPCLISSVTDITGLRQAEQHRQQAEASLWQAQKLESIGLLAGGVAHDFNNLLGIIMGYAEMMLEEDQDRGTASRLGSIVEAVERAQALTRQLLMFSRKQVISPRPVAVNRLIENALKMYRRLIGEDIRLHFEPGDELPEVMADPQQLEQVLANLLINARDGIHALGTDRTGAVIRVSTCMEHLEAGNSQSGAHPAGDYLCLEVQDSGCGMEPAVIERIFDPFFTTKALGKGTGLGLATVLGVVSQNAGVIQVHSRPGEGACFRIHWPAIARAEQPGEALVRSRDLPGGSEHILLVEDEPTLLELGRKLLSRKGYSVSPAASAEQAVALAQGLHHPPDLLVTDLVLPGINGRQLAEALQERWPQLRVLYTSGYTHDILDRYDLDRDGHELLHKPYSMADLLSRVRTLLDGE